MGYQLSSIAFQDILDELSQEYVIFAPKRFEAGGHFSDTDSIRYGEVTSVLDIVFDQPTVHSFKEALLPITQLLFYFTEDNTKEAAPPPKGALIFLRSCDLHAVKRLDEIYLNNGIEDYYYSRIRDKIRFALISCPQAFSSCFCVDMGTNRSENYDFAVTPTQNQFLIDCQNAEWEGLFAGKSSKTVDATPVFVTETETRVQIPETIDAKTITQSPMWEEYDTRCINCGRCNYSCPTCTCYTMQDIFYTDNGRSGERRRVWASCMVDGYTDVAGGGSYRKKNGERMRFKTLHKAHDFKQRFGYQMCVGCGRCDDVCPEYISFSKILNTLSTAMEEAQEVAQDG